MGVIITQDSAGAMIAGLAAVFAIARLWGLLRDFMIGGRDDG